MNKKRIIWLVIAIIVVVIAIGVFAIYNGSDKTEENKVNENNESVESENIALKENQNNENKVEDNTTSNGSKILVVYYSAQTHTKAVAEKIADNLEADIFEIVPKEVYTSEDLSWNNGNSRVSREHDDESLRNIELVNTDVENWENYDTILIGYPIWWGIAAWPVNTFVKANDFNGKTVIPFCTSASSGLGQSGELLAEEANSGNWETGHRFSSNPLDSDIEEWTESIK